MRKVVRHGRDEKRRREGYKESTGGSRVKTGKKGMCT
jgi:hypothetical protein